MWDYFVEETLTTGEKVTIPFDTEEEMENYIKRSKKDEALAHRLDTISPKETVSCSMERIK